MQDNLPAVARSPYTGTQGSPLLSVTIKVDESDVATINAAKT